MKRFLKDEEGTITIEFVIWLPFLFAWFIGTIVFFDAYKTRSHAAKVTYTLGDIVSRTEIMTNAWMDNLYNLEAQMLPRIGTGLALRVTSIEYRQVSPGVFEHVVLWSKTRGQGVTPMTKAEIPVGILPTMVPAETVILVDTYVPYIPMADWVGLHTQYWQNTVVDSPRFYPKITFQN